MKHSFKAHVINGCFTDSFTDILFTLFDCIFNCHIDMVFVNFSAHRATLKNIIIYS